MVISNSKWFAAAKWAVDSARRRRYLHAMSVTASATDGLADWKPAARRISRTHGRRRTCWRDWGFVGTVDIVCGDLTSSREIGVEEIRLMDGVDSPQGICITAIIDIILGEVPS